MLAGQFVASLIIDHYGHLGLAIQSVTPGKIVGVLLMVGGVACVRWL
jgi:transporter family-2 protein